MGCKKASPLFLVFFRKKHDFAVKRRLFRRFIYGGFLHRRQTRKDPSHENKHIVSHRNPNGGHLDCGIGFVSFFNRRFRSGRLHWHRDGTGHGTNASRWLRRRSQHGRHGYDATRWFWWRYGRHDASWGVRRRSRRSRHGWSRHGWSRWSWHGWSRHGRSRWRSRRPAICNR